MKINLFAIIAIGVIGNGLACSQVKANETGNSLTTIERNDSIAIEPEKSKVDWLKISTECYQSERQRKRVGIVATQSLNLAERDYCRYLSTFSGGKLPNSQGERT